TPPQAPTGRYCLIQDVSTGDSPFYTSQGMLTFPPESSFIAPRWGLGTEFSVFPRALPWALTLAHRWCSEIAQLQKAPARDTTRNSQPLRSHARDAAFLACCASDYRQLHCQCPNSGRAMLLPSHCDRCLVARQELALPDL